MKNTSRAQKTFPFSLEHDGWGFTSGLIPERVRIEIRRVVPPNGRGWSVVHSNTEAELAQEVWLLFPQDGSSR